MFPLERPSKRNSGEFRYVFASGHSRSFALKIEERSNAQQVDKNVHPPWAQHLGSSVISPARVPSIFVRTDLIMRLSSRASTALMALANSSSITFS